MKREIKDRTYRLLRGSAPLTFILPSRNSRRSPLMYFDEAKNENRVLRYAANQKSIFEDEQDGNAIISPIIFEDGFLTVPKNNPILQEFLYYHPMNGKKFEEVDNEKDAKEELDYLEMEIAEAVGRILLSSNVANMTTAELRRDLMVYARRDAQGFMAAVTNPELQLMSKINKFIDERLISIRNNGRDVHYNLKDNKKRLVAVPFGDETINFLASYFKSDEGVEVLEFLEKQLK
jgi:hypothetical protein